jgi:hypothetical protein
MFEPFKNKATLSLETSGTAYILTQRHKPAWLESYITPL